MSQLVALLLILSGNQHFNTRLGPEREAAILAEVAAEYQLDEEQTRLLFCVRRIENGDPVKGIEMGVGENGDHPARRYAGDAEASLRLQAMWASGTIAKHYRGDLTAWSRRWCPVNALAWERMAREISK